MSDLLVDAGPLVAFLAERDQYHELCRSLMRQVRPPLITSWAVLTEAAYLLRDRPHGVRGLFEFVDQGFLTIAAIDESALRWFDAFFQRYADHEPQLADASLIYLAEQLKIDTIFTFDHRHFRIYRMAGNQAPVLYPSHLP
jgi:predicted nucleic acid-binding protein